MPASSIRATPVRPRSSRCSSVATKGSYGPCHVPVALAALLASLWAGWAVRDRLAGIAIAAIASLVLLPVTWYHYPTALIPFAVAAVVRARGSAAAQRTGALIAAAAVVATLSIAWIPGMWLAVGLGLAGVIASGRTSDNRSA